MAGVVPASRAMMRGQQLIVLRRRLHGRVRLTNNDRWFLIQLYPWFPSILQVLTIIRPETLVRWHKAAFRCYATPPPIKQAQASCYCFAFFERRLCCTALVAFGGWTVLVAERLTTISSLSVIRPAA
jgi:hypothetical protein